MPRPRPPHLVRQVSRHGKVKWFYRVYPGPRVRINAEYGTPMFWAAYEAAGGGRAPAVGSPAPILTIASPHSLSWLIAQYRSSTAWQNLGMRTQRQRESFLLQVLKSAGGKSFAYVDEATIIEGRDRRKDTPSAARHFLDTMRGLFRWAKDAKHVAVDPTAGIKNLVRKSGEGFRAWSEEDVEAYQRHWPIGTRQRVWFDVLLYTGLRTSDAVRFGRQHVRGGIGRIKLDKSGRMIEVALPILPVLQATLDAGEIGDMSFIVNANGRPFSAGSFSNSFVNAVRAAGLPAGLSAHGVRKIAATTAANNGATVAQLKALFGWTSDTMPALYTKTADRERLALTSAHMLGNQDRTGTGFPLTQPKVRGKIRKTK